MTTIKPVFYVEMLGYSSEKSSYELYQHAKHLDEKVPIKYKKEMDCIYDWVKTKEFCSAMDHNTKESWLWLKKSIMNPPLKVIHKYASEAKESTDIWRPKLSIRKPEVPCCRLCNTKLADNILQKVKFSIIICKCDTLWCHTKCAEEYCLKFPSCSTCKQYFILSPCCSNIQSKLEDLMKRD